MNFLQIRTDNTSEARCKANCYSLHISDNIHTTLQARFEPTTGDTSTAVKSPSISANMEEKIKFDEALDLFELVVIDNVLVASLECQLCQIKQVEKLCHPWVHSGLHYSKQ